MDPVSIKQKYSKESLNKEVSFIPVIKVVYVIVNSLSKR